MTRLHRLLCGALLCASMVTCVDGPTDAGRFASLAVAPSFQVDPALFPSGPIDRVRLVAIDASTSQIVGTADVTVDPSQTSWSLPLEIDLGGQPSLDVLVEIELLSGAAVEWSGRLGPISVGAGATPVVRGIDVHRGSLDNLDVTALAIQGAPGQLNVGATAVLTAVPTLAGGSTTVPTIYWASSNPAVATVTATGASVTVTALSVGSADIVATAGPADDEVAVAVVAVAPPGFDVEWRGTTTDWTTPSNWSTGQVPQSTDDVFIPAAAAVDPTISTLTQVARLTVETGATLTVAGTGLTVSGDLDAQGSISGAGDVFLTGTGATARGTLQIPVQVSGTVAAGGALTAPSLTVDGSGASFDVAGQAITVQTQLRTQAGGVLRSTAAGGSMSTFDAFFLGGSTAGLLTAGELRVRGDFLALTDPSSFVASGTHTVVFEGTQSQVASFSDPGTATQRFQNVTFDNAAGVSFTSNVVAMGAVQVAAGTVLIDDYTLSLAGSLVDPAAGLVFAELNLIGPVTALPAALGGQVTVNASVTWPNDATLSGTLYVPGALNLGTRTLTVAGDVHTDGALTVPTGGALAISGTLSLASGSTLHVDGTVTGRCVDGGATITGTGTHPCGAASGTKQWVGGDAAGPIDWHNPNNWSPPGVPGPSDDVVTPVDLSIQLTADASVRSLIVGDATYIDLGGFTLTVESDLVAPWYIDNGIVQVTGAGTLLEGYLPDVVVLADRTLSGALQMSGALTISDADLTPAGQYLFVAADLVVSGPAGHLVMTNTSDYVWIGGSATFDGGDHTGLLNAGLMVVQGSLSATGSSNGGFVGSGTHAVQLLGSAPQTVSFAVPGLQAQRFQYLYVSSSGGVTFTTSASAAGSVDLTGGVVVPSATTLEVAGTLSLYPGAILQVDGTVTAGTCSNYGGQITGTGQHPCPPSPVADRTWIGGDAQGPTDWNVAANWGPAGVPLASETVYIPYTTSQPVLTSNETVAGLFVDYGATLDLDTFTLSVDGDLAVNGIVIDGVVDLVGVGSTLFGALDGLRVSVPRALSGDLTLYGTVEILDALTIGPHGLFTDGDLSVVGQTGVLRMDDPNGDVSVMGTATFDGASHAGALTSGYLYLVGDLTVGETFVSDAFRSDGTTVYLSNAQALQTVSLSRPADQYFADLFLSLPQVAFTQGAVVNGTFSSGAGTLFQQGAQPIEVRGRVSVNGTTFDGLPLRLISSVAPNLHTLSGVTFTNMPLTASQLVIDLVGGGPNQPFRIDSPVFATAPQQGGFYIAATNSSQAGAQLVIEVLTPTPSARPSELSEGPLTTIVW